MSHPPTVAVVGRQNVGKSTLVNRLHGRRQVVAHEMPGVTRDRVDVETSWRGRSFVITDTGGYEPNATGIEALVSAQAARAVDVADLVLLVVDGSAGVREDDAALARKLQRADVSVLLVVNKIDGDRDDADVASFFSLGLGEPIAVSALHGRGSGDLLDAMVALLPETVEDADPAEEEPRIAIVGRPNVGKSSIFNALLGEERSVVYEESGTTRDAVDAVVDWDGVVVRFVDTAGFRRTTKTRAVEYFSLIRSEQAISRAHVALLVVDASQGLTTEDKKIANKVLQAGRGLALAANKWDLVGDKDKTFRDIAEEVAIFAGADAVRTSALTNVGISRLKPVLMAVHGRWSTRVSTARVNKILEAAQGERPAPRETGRFLYGTQVASSPPNFVFFGGRQPGVAYARYLENRLRRELGLAGVPIRLRFRPKKRKRD